MLPKSYAVQMVDIVIDQINRFRSSLQIYPLELVSALFAKVISWH